MAKPKHRADWLVEGWTPYETVRDPRKCGDRSILRSYLNGDYIEAAIEPSKLAGLPVVYGRIEGDKLQFSVVAGGNLAPVYLTAPRHRRLFKKSALTGFPLHVEIKNRLWRELEAKVQIEMILAHRFLKLGLRHH